MKTIVEVLIFLFLIMVGLFLLRYEYSNAVSLSPIAEKGFVLKDGITAVPFVSKDVGNVIYFSVGFNNAMDTLQVIDLKVMVRSDDTAQTITLTEVTGYNDTSDLERYVTKSSFSLLPQIAKRWTPKQRPDKSIELFFHTNDIERSRNYYI